MHQNYVPIGRKGFHDLSKNDLTVFCNGCPFLKQERQLFSEIQAISEGGWAEYHSKICKLEE